MTSLGDGEAVVITGKPVRCKLIEETFSWSYRYWCAFWTLVTYDAGRIRCMPYSNYQYFEIMVHV